VKKILFALLAVVAAIGLMGGAFAYFTDVEKSTGNTMTAGTLDMEIADIDEAYTNNPVTHSFDSPVGLLPGQKFDTERVWVKNVGTSPIRWIWARFCGLSESDGVNTDAEQAAATATDISNYIELESAWDSRDGGVTWSETKFEGNPALADAFLSYWNTRGASFTLDGSISLHDLVAANDYGSGDRVTSIVFFNDSLDPNPPALPSGAVGVFKFTFKLLETTTNAYQGDTATFEVDFIGSTRSEYPDDLLADYITEALGQP
jgi:predicted ribosomally synthesized peptide with SipW-like signal peptide